MAEFKHGRLHAAGFAVVRRCLDFWIAGQPHESDSREWWKDRTIMGICLNVKERVEETGSWRVDGRGWNGKEEQNFEKEKRRGELALPKNDGMGLFHILRDVDPYFRPVWARGRCRISPPRFLAECCKRQRNQGSFVLLYFRLSTFSDLY